MGGTRNGTWEYSEHAEPDLYGSDGTTSCWVQIPFGCQRYEDPWPLGRTDPGRSDNLWPALRNSRKRYEEYWLLTKGILVLVTWVSVVVAATVLGKRESITVARIRHLLNQSNWSIGLCWLIYVASTDRVVMNSISTSDPATSYAPTTEWIDTFDEELALPLLTSADHHQTIVQFGPARPLQSSVDGRIAEPPTTAGQIW